MRQIAGLAIVLVILVVSVSPAQAYVFGFSNLGNNVELILNGGTSLRPYDAGWYGANGFHDPTNDNYIVTRTGESTGCVGPCNNWFAFDISNVLGQVNSAVLRLNSFTVTTTDTYSLFDYTGSISDLTGGTGGVGAHADLGGGIFFGSRMYSNADTGSFQSIALNANFLTALNNALINEQSQFAFGGTIEPNVPEPATMTLTGLGLIGLFVSRRRGRRGKSA